MDRAGGTVSRVPTSIPGCVFGASGKVNPLFEAARAGSGCFTEQLINVQAFCEENPDYEVRERQERPFVYFVVTLDRLSVSE